MGGSCASVSPPFSLDESHTPCNQTVRTHKLHNFSDIAQFDGNDSIETSCNAETNEPSDT